MGIFLSRVCEKKKVSWKKLGILGHILGQSISKARLWNSNEEIQDKSAVWRNRSWMGSWERESISNSLLK